MQIELVFTVDNTSDSMTEWKDSKGGMHQQWTEPNSMLVIIAEGCDHRSCSRSPAAPPDASGRCPRDRARAAPHATDTTAPPPTDTHSLGIPRDP